MKGWFLAILSIGVLSAVFAEYEDICGIENVPSSESGRIIGGQETSPNQFPWVVAIKMKSFLGSGRCTGSIVNKRFILTAAHCVQGFKRFEVLAGSHDYSLDEEPHRQFVKGSKGIGHPDFVNSGLEYHDDIALIELDEDLEFNEYVRPTCLPKFSDAANDFVNENVTLTGWGLIKGRPNPVSVPQLYYVEDINIIENTICAQTYGSIINENLMCIDSSDHTGVCSGDSGGPMNLPVGNNKYLQIGVADFVGGLTCDDGKPEGYARVTSYLKWIQDISGRTIEE